MNSERRVGGAIPELRSLVKGRRWKVSLERLDWEVELKCGGRRKEEIMKRMKDKRKVSKKRFEGWLRLKVVPVREFPSNFEYWRDLFIFEFCFCILCNEWMICIRRAFITSSALKSYILCITLEQILCDSRRRGNNGEAVKAGKLKFENRKQLKYLYVFSTKRHTLLTSFEREKTYENTH